jgi:lipopolysaccharide/colanic/teichoic acid biosynthesis glycosyltransferase
MKRLLDFTLAAVLLAAFIPLLVLVALGVWLTMGSPILFCQVRPGKSARPFRLFKFRTMRDAIGPDGRPLSDEKRLTPFGAILRRFSIDELPQLINVLLGNMSLVGPRPLLMDYLPRYTPEQYRRHLVSPGITGWAQVNGRNAISWEERFRLDVWYVDHQTFFLDLKILWLTVRKVFAREGISAQGHVTMPEFLGARSDTGPKSSPPSKERA